MKDIALTALKLVCLWCAFFAILLAMVRWLA